MTSNVPADDRHCPACGGARIEPRGDHHWRCLDCGVTDWKNPLPVAGTLVLRDDRVLLVRRSEAMEFGAGGWTFPGGFVERGETPWEAAVRETEEEANVRPHSLRALAPRTVIDPHRVVMPFLARIDDDVEPMPGPESAAVAWVRFDDIPWDKVPFSTSVEALRGIVAGDTGTTTYRSVSSPGRMRAMAHCARCGAALGGRDAEGVVRCAQCGTVRWDNPSPCAGLLAIHDRRVLLGQRRAGRDGAGAWAIPSGHMEPGETPAQTAEREFLEETSLVGRAGEFVGMYASGDHCESVYLGSVAEPSGQRSEEFAALEWFDGPTAASLSMHHGTPDLIAWAREVGLLD